MPHRILYAFLALLFLEESEATSLPRGVTEGKLRVIVSSDIGGTDNDDYQSFVHLLVYADVFDIEGLVSSPQPGRPGSASGFLRGIAAYERDFPALKRYSTSRFAYPTPAALRQVVRQGARPKSTRTAFHTLTAGSRHIIERARSADPRPLYILCWSGMRDVAAALHNAPDIKGKIRVYSIGTTNTKHDPIPRDYVARYHPDLWWVENNTTMRGMYLGGARETGFGNKNFVLLHVRNHGALGQFYYQMKQTLKMGDTPSVLFLLDGGFRDPESDSWGGRFQRVPGRTRAWRDLPRGKEVIRSFPGAATIAKWRQAYLEDFAARMDRTLPKGG